MTAAFEQSGEFYGFQIAKAIKKDDRAGRSFAAMGTLYRALDWLVQQGYLTRRWEDPGISEQEHRPRRRRYQVTGKAVPIDAAVACPVKGSSLLASWEALA